MNIKQDDIVRITVGPPDKIGKVGKVTNIIGNGAIVELAEDWFTPVKFEHLEKVGNNGKE